MRMAASADHHPAMGGPMGHLSGHPARPGLGGEKRLKIAMGAAALGVIGSMLFAPDLTRYLLLTLAAGALLLAGQTLVRSLRARPWLAVAGLGLAVGAVTLSGGVEDVRAVAFRWAALALLIAAFARLPKTGVVLRHPLSVFRSPRFLAVSMAMLAWLATSGAPGASKAHDGATQAGALVGMDLVGWVLHLIWLGGS